MPRGFSQSTWQPASSAWRIKPRWCTLGTAITTASGSVSLRSPLKSLNPRSMPHSCWHRARTSGSTSQIPAISTPGMRENPGKCTPWHTMPSPARPIFNLAVSITTSSPLLFQYYPLRLLVPDPGAASSGTRHPVAPDSPDPQAFRPRTPPGE